MSGLRYFARDQHWLWITAAGLLAAAVAFLLGPTSVQITSRANYLPLTSAATLLPAIAIQATLGRFATPAYRLSSRDMRWWALLHIVGGTLFAALCLALALLPAWFEAAGLSGAQAESELRVGAPAMIRCLIAYTGTALIAMRVIGVRFAWVAPLMWVMIPFVVPAYRIDDPLGLVLLPIQPDRAIAPWILAIGLWVLGVALTLLRVR
ncbi:MAG: hypothetical protein ACK5LO_07270 [Leucobacter sp.]